MKVVSRAAVLGLAGLVAFGAAGCNRGGSGGGTTTIIQQAPPINGGSAQSNSLTPSVTQTPISDSKKLCSLAQGRGLEIVHAIDKFWGLVMKDGWSWGDEKVASAADNAGQVVSKVAPVLEAAIGSGAPKDIADAIQKFVKSSRSFADAITNRADGDTMNPLNKDFGAAVDNLKAVCSI
ncbi:hypothetical protein [Segniliparus rotundus]|nr:hypothetical protein [Segniliparus rotundus]